MAAAAAAVAAKLSAAAPASGGSGLSLDQKKKLLWGSKKKEVAEEAAPQAVFGQNRWDRAEFTSEQDRLKFIKLMGGKAAAETLLQHGPTPEAALAAAGPELPAFGPAPLGGHAGLGPAALQAAGAKAAADGPAGYDLFQPHASAEGGGPAAAVAEGPALPAPPPAGTAAAAPGARPDIMRRDGQARVLSQLEREFETGLRRQLGANRAAGLGAL